MILHDLLLEVWSWYKEIKHPEGKLRVSNISSKLKPTVARDIEVPEPSAEGEEAEEN
jgi:hypothetical protein